MGKRSRSLPPRKRATFEDAEPSELQRLERIRGARIEHVIGHRSAVSLDGWLEEDPVNCTTVIEYVALLRRRVHGKGPDRTRNIPRWVRAAVWDKTGGFCIYCNQALNPFDNFTVDHVVPLSRGGTSGVENLVPACSGCNTRKADSESLSW